MNSKPTKVIELGNFQDSKTTCIYSTYDDNQQSLHEFTVYKNSRCLIQMLDRSKSLSLNLIEAFKQIESEKTGDQRPSASERFLLFMLGRTEIASSNTFREHNRSDYAISNIGSMHRIKTWRIVKLQGWFTTSVLILHRTQASTKTNISQGTRTTYNWARLSVADAKKLLESIYAHQSFD